MIYNIIISFSCCPVKFKAVYIYLPVESGAEVESGSIPAKMRTSSLLNLHTRLSPFSRICLSRASGIAEIKEQKSGQ